MRLLQHIMKIHKIHTHIKQIEKWANDISNYSTVKET